MTTLRRETQGILPLLLAASTFVIVGGLLRPFAASASPGAITPAGLLLTAVVLAAIFGVPTTRHQALAWLTAPSRVRPFSLAVLALVGLLVKSLLSGTLTSSLALTATPLAQWGIFDAVPVPLWSLLPFAVLLGPLMEEVLFRGYGVLAFAERNTITGVAAVVGSSLAFALVHPWSPAGLLSSFLAGLLYGTIALWTRTLWAPLLLHSLNNLLFAFVVLW
jgi:membrane protease YdiL (CAAX protease family)